MLKTEWGSYYTQSSFQDSEIFMEEGLERL